MTIELAQPDPAEEEPRLYRFAPDGRYLGWVTQDQPIERYADRTDLTTEPPCDVDDGCWPYRIAGAWAQQQDPPRPVPPTPTREPAPGGAP